MQVISASRSEWIAPFTGLEPGQFRKLVRVVARRGGDEIADGRPGRQWRLPLADRVLLVATYWRTNLTMRQIGPLFGVSHSAAHRVIDSLGPLLALAPVRRRRIDQIAIVDGTLVPTRDHRLAARSKNYRYSTNLQVAIDADTRLVIATGDPQPGNRNDCTVYRDSGMKQALAGRPVMADGGYQGNPEVIMPYRKPRDGADLPDWKEDLNTVHRSIRARAEHALARMKCWKILRDYRRAAHTLADTASGIAHLHNLALTG
ncbi:transposase family protein [Allokutzneria albata]|uniref:Helix-turn-helix of DDE superfamily endonuclease n=1 Tax=Allokutzneria albata TaxID=211114 RepID=A0A1G9Y7U6_ALLAB|nr:transposase family protein [Allokutzneria albata]SDM31506.1 Helix-turn-helix of DDE superfamily endonuclease [Allokutzneria albata]SDN04621.1 Helix-turn-helix of DDE superfamily endonuclease [Allokutzneria albata]SDN04865.1 Helix-turn-helix of DDE superfamily endonuclease [Allokutzneria albata]SDN05154.1 Helix-turn-helix of DDE superfamily endonuclease [Allokutzneria albata]SDN55542.1 Helix-turn-helix of DDE superfamily endonuclease [Allokutzneria albata]